MTRKGRPLASRAVPFGILPTEDVRVGDHIAYFWETDAQFDQAVTFLTAGLAQVDHAVVFGHEEANRRVCDVLESRGVRTQDLVQQRRLTVVGAESSGDATLSKLAGIFERALSEGAPVIRLLGNIGWNRPEWPGEDDILLFEAKVTAAARQFPAVVVCMYDVRSLSGRMIMQGGFGTHPITVCGNVMRVNPHHEQHFDRFAVRVRETSTAPGGGQHM